MLFTFPMHMMGDMLGGFPACGTGDHVHAHNPVQVKIDHIYEQWLLANIPTPIWFTKYISNLFLKV